MRKNLIGLNDNELATLFSSGEELAFTEIFNRYYQRIIFFVNKMTKDKSLSEDITQETFLKVSVALTKNQYRGEGFSGWIHKIATNNALDHFKQQKSHRVESVENMNHFVSRTNPASILEWKDNLATLYRIAEILGGKQKIAINLKIQGLSNHEIKAVASIGKPHIIYSVHAAKEKFNLIMKG